MKVWSLGYKKTKEKAQKIYKGIGIVKSPALNNEEVVFNRKGFNHLIRKGRAIRAKNEQKERLRLIPYIEEVVTNPEALVAYTETTVEEIVNRRGLKVLKKSKGRFWNFFKQVDDCVVRVTIRQLNDGNKHFFSVWGNNVQRGQEKKI